MRTNILVLFLALFALVSPAQVTNRCLKFDSGGTVNCGPLPELDITKQFTVQAWVKPAKFDYGDAIFVRGNLRLFLSKNENELIFRVGPKELTITSQDITKNKWAQITLIVEDSQLKAYVNGFDVTPKNASFGDLSGKNYPAQVMTLGGVVPSDEGLPTTGFSGLIDEVRIWGCALPDDFEHYAFTTVNKHNPHWDDLLVYYKMDQAKTGNGTFYEERLIDYKEVLNGSANKNFNGPYNNHGLLSNGVSFVDSDNDNHPYLFHSGYLDNARFFDTYISQEQYLLYNEVIIRGAQCDPNESNNNGFIYTRTPNNHAKSIVGGEYMAEFEGRNGVLALNGEDGSRIELADSTLYPSSQYTFETWIYLDEWTPGGYILRRENDEQTEGIAVLLGEEGIIKIRINGTVFTTTTSGAVSSGQWFYLAISNRVNEKGIRVFAGKKKELAGNNGELSSIFNETTTDISSTPKGNEKAPCYMGENLKCKFDNVCFWKILWWKGEDQTYNLEENMAGNIPMPGIGKTPEAGLNYVDTYLTFDDPKNLCFSSHSQDSWLKIIKSAYEGHAGVKFFLSVYINDPDNTTVWKKIINQEAYRRTFASRLADLSEGYDGVVLDLEWPNDNNTAAWGSWAQYALLVREVRTALNELDEKKELRIFTLNTNYFFPKEYMNDVDAFIFQQYGSKEETHYKYSQFETDIQTFKNYEFPSEKIIASYSPNTSLGTPLSSTSILNNYTFGQEKDDLVSAEHDGNTHYYMTPGQAYKRAKYARENGLKGIFNGDISADVWEQPAPMGIRTMGASTASTPSLSLHVGYALSSNVDPPTGPVTVDHYNSDPVLSGVNNIIEDTAKNCDVNVIRQQGSAEASVTIGGEPAAYVAVYNLTGRLVSARNGSTFNADTLTPGIYIVAAKAADGRQGKTKFFLGN